MQLIMPHMCTTRAGSRRRNRLKRLQYGQFVVIDMNCANSDMFGFRSWVRALQRSRRLSRSRLMPVLACCAVAPTQQHGHGLCWHSVARHIASRTVELGHGHALPLQSFHKTSSQVAVAQAVLARSFTCNNSPFANCILTDALR